MRPAYRDKQLVVVNKHDLRFQHGDTVAFWSQELSCVLVKRVVAIPDDTVVIRDGKLYVNNRESDVFGDSCLISYAGILENEISLQADEYVVLGDNLEESVDSRYAAVGVITVADIYGRISFPVAKPKK